MNTMIINPLIVSVKPTGVIVIPPIDPTMHKGGVGRIVAVAAAIAIPYAAPYIASSIAASGALGATISGALTAGTATYSGAAWVAASAITGAALGAISAVVSGQKISIGALTGGLGGALGGYLSMPAASPMNIQGTPTGLDVSSAAGGGAPSIPDIGLAPPGVSPADAVFGPPATRGGMYSGYGGATDTLQLSSVGYMSEADTGVLAQTKTELAGRFKSPEILANVTILAGAQIIGALLVPEGTLPDLPPEAKELYDLRKAELETLKLRDEEAFNHQMAISKQFLVNAGYLDPSYYGNQAANELLINAGRQKLEEERKLSLKDWRGISPSEERRVGLDIAGKRASAFDEGYIKALGLKGDETRRAAVTYPSGSQYTTYSDQLGRMGEGINQAYTAASAADANAQAARDNIAKIGGAFATGITGKSDEEKEKELYNAVTAGLNTSEIDYGVDKKKLADSIASGGGYS